MSPRFFSSRAAVGAAASAALLALGCSDTATPAQGAAAGPPPAAVEIRTLESRPVEHASEFIATVRSLSSTTVQPEVEGLVTRIFVKSGDRVKKGAPLMQIDPERQVQHGCNFEPRHCCSIAGE